MAQIAIKSRIYLDHAATTPALPAAIAAMAEAAATIGNPSSVHSGGRTANAIIERARDTIAAWAACKPDQLIFTSGGTEALALALNTQLRILASATEHSAVLAARPDAALIPVDSNGVLDLTALAEALKAGPALIAVQHANNETGVIQPIAEIAALVTAANSLLLVDAVQSATKLPLPQADYIALSAHKLGGTPGTGALIARDPTTITAVQRGGGQERGLRGGTPNLPGIAAFAAAIAQTPDWSHTETLRNHLESRLATRINGACAPLIVGASTPRLPNITNLALPGIASGTQVMALDLAGIMVSAGAACSSGKVATSHVLTAMGHPSDAIRISLGPTTTAAEVEAFITGWQTMAARLTRHPA
nr:cysteine desulfurase family protein [Polymorphobacter sp.]